MNYDVTHEHCHNRQKREEHKPIDLRWVIHRHTIAPERPLSSINIYMLSFKQFLVEGGGKMFGIDPFGNRSRAEVEKFAKDVGYQVEYGPKHIKIINPKTGQLVAALSHGANRNEFAERYALKHIAQDLQRSGSVLRPNMDAKQVSSMMRNSEKPPGSFPMASIGAAGIAGAGAMVGSALTQGVQAASNAMGGLLTMPPARTRMEREKDLQSDVGLAFDIDPDNELMASPEGFKAVAARQKEGRGFPTALPTEAGIDPDANWGNQMTFGEVGRQGLDGSNVGFENAYGLGKIMYGTPPNKQRIHAEKDLNTDIGLAFDVDEYGEPVGDLGGFRAVTKRAEEGRSQPTTYPPKTFDEYSGEWRDNAIQAAKDMLEPETYEKLLKLMQQGFK